MSRPTRDVAGDATRIATAILRRNNCAVPEAVTTEILAALHGNHIGLVDTTPPEDPNADWRPPAHTTAAAADTPGTTAYQQARAALRATTTTDQEGQQ